MRRLPDGAADLTITSPPYNKGAAGGRLVGEVKYDGCPDDMPEADYQAGQAAVLDEIWRATRPGGSCFYNHKLRYRDGEALHPLRWLDGTRWGIRDEIVWDRTLAANIRGWRFWQTSERIWWLYKPGEEGPVGREIPPSSARLSSVWRGLPETRSSHPAPFPIWLPARIIISLLGDASKDGGPPGLVLDPYAGSGTTAAAARLLGHDYIGIDASADYLRSAERRLEGDEGDEAETAREADRHYALPLLDECGEEGELPL